MIQANKAPGGSGGVQERKPEGGSPEAAAAATPPQPYRQLNLEQTMSAPKVGARNYGDKLKSAQNDLQKAGYYGPGASYRQEVDGKFGARTAGAVKRLQSDLKTAGLYNGAVHGALDKQTLQALSQLKSRPLKEGLDPAAASRLKSFNESAGAAPKPPSPVDSFTATPGKAPLVELSPKPNQTGKIIDNTASALSRLADPGNTMSGEARLAAAADLGRKLAESPDGGVKSMAVVKSQLGIDPEKSGPEGMRALLTAASNQLVPDHAVSPNYSQTFPTPAAVPTSNWDNYYGDRNAPPEMYLVPDPRG
jgi:peptidoglycan hydrolase-like protein with peptidoglycan-binding domain